MGGLLLRGRHILDDVTDCGNGSRTTEVSQSEPKGESLQPTKNRKQHHMSVLAAVLAFSMSAIGFLAGACAPGAFAPNAPSLEADNR